MEIAKGAIGPEVNYDISMKEGSVVGSVEFKGADGTVKIEGAFKFIPLLERGAAALKKLIPGEFDDGVIDIAVGTLKNAMK